MANNVKSYYAVIPANVRYDKNLPANAKLLYGEVTALCNQSGICWADNGYFANLYDVDDRTIQRWVSALVDKGYLYRNIRYGDDGKTTVQRCLSLVEIDIAGMVHRMSPPDKIVVGVRQNCREGDDKNVVDNNTRINITTNIKEKDTYVSKKKDATSRAARTVFRKPTVEEIAEYCKSRNNQVDPQRFFDYYESNGWKVGRNSMKDWKATVRTWERNGYDSRAIKGKTADAGDEGWMGMLENL